MSFGPNPWQQTSWDWRAAGNFIGGGAGTGLLIASALLATPLASAGWTANWLLLVGLALVAAGLLCVWLEIGRPWRALHVFFNPRTSWMSREGFVAVLLFPAGLLAVLGMAGWIWPTAALAAAFLYCQSRMLPAARGIPAWRPRVVTALVFVTGLCEGLGLFVMLGGFHGKVSGAVMLLLGALVVTRLAIWMRYRRVVDVTLAPRARVALDITGRWMLFVGTVAPVALLGLGVFFPSGAMQPGLTLLAGACAVFAGIHAKYTLVTRASFNQGFSLTRMPVRGVRTSP